MMALGLFVFSLKTIPYQQLQQNREWRHPTQNRIGVRPASQFLGVGEESISLSGRLATSLTGGRIHLELLKTMADQGTAWPLIGGNGWLYGLYVITGLDQTYAEMMDNGAARMIDFTLALKRVDDDRLDILGDVTDAILALI